MADSEKTPAPVSDLLNHPAFDEAYLDLTRYAYTRARTSAEADEVVSDTVLCWVQDVRAGKHIDNLPGYLRTVFERRLCDYLRRKYRREVEMSDDGTILDRIPDDSDPEALDRSLREAEAVRRALGRLAAIYREVVYRHYMKGQGVEEIARALGVSAGTVKSRLSDGRGQMKETVAAHLNQDLFHGTNSVATTGKPMNDKKKPLLPTPARTARCPTRPRKWPLAFGATSVAKMNPFAIRILWLPRIFWYWPTRSPSASAIFRRRWVSPPLTSNTRSMLW